MEDYAGYQPALILFILPAKTDPGTGTGRRRQQLFQDGKYHTDVFAVLHDLFF